jgi:hypothetical protein
MDRVQLSVMNAATFDEKAAAENQRRPGRMRCEELACRNGRVVDLSHTGARIRIRSWLAPRGGGARTLIFDTAMGKSAPFACRVVWVRRLVWTRYELGLEFADLTEAQRVQLAEIARVHGGRTTVRDLDKKSA